MRLLYQAITYLIYPCFYLLKFFIRSDWSLRWHQGLAENLPQTKSNLIWLHAVSVGELKVALQIVDILSSNAEYNFLITTTTFSGYNQVNKVQNKKLINCYMPFDLPVVIKKFINHFQPKIAIIIETEIWPNWINCLHKKNIPIILANARLSDKSMQKYYLAKNMFKQVLNQVDLLIVQSDKISQRFLNLGVDEHRIQVVNNLKYDLSINKTKHNIKDGFHQWQSGYKTLLTTSTHANEEDMLLQAFTNMEQNNLRLILVPRHPNRAEGLVALCKQYSLTAVKYSVMDNLDADVLIVDTFGDLPALYSCHDMAFIGGSLIKHGGHNPIEAIVEECMVIVGQNVFNFEDIYQKLSDANAIMVVDNFTELSKLWSKCLCAEDFVADINMQAYKLLKQISGKSAQQYKAAIVSLLNSTE